MLKKLFIGLVLLYFIGKTTDVIRTYFAPDEVTVLCTMCDCEKEKAETDYFDEDSAYFKLTVHQSALFLRQRISYPFKAKALLVIALIRFSPPPELV
ncbi:hypothetical protein GCM10027275_17430 [Rhabdobacter roseus]|uniref:Uncharacterized protein n=1 Tax=Rhabdobacter roseus TaxID=1655419 RepID=A0A840TUE0_9BACT|nr:hypothetical protein [Rhabdobacter roseus]MBB5283668.1 hypothetical protein [Rhabdobacter roseus]